MKLERQKRSDIPEHYKWDLSSLYKCSVDFEEDLKKVYPLVDKLVSFKGTIMASASNLYEVISLSLEIDHILTNLYVYAHMKYDEDSTNNDALTLKGRIQKIYTNINEKLVFIPVEILKAKYSLIEKYIREVKELEIYKFYFERLFRQKKHVLSHKEESILASSSEILSAPRNIHTTLNDTDLKFGSIVIDDNKVEITASNFIKLLNHKNQNVRGEVFKTYYHSYADVKNTMAEIINYKVKEEAFVSKVRKYDSPLHMALYDNNININVYHNLIKTVNDNLSVLHKYVALKKKELDVSELHMYDIYADMVKDVDKEYNYENATKLVENSLKPLGKDYLNVVKEAFNNRWIDVYDNIGKRSGAYSFGTYDSNPYILLNFNGTIDSVSTIAHEMGHSMHSYYTHKNQPYVYGSYAIFVAEVASTVNEILFNRYMYENTNDNNIKKHLLNELMNHFKGTLYRQTMFAEFELALYNKEMNNEVLTENVISDLYYDLNKKYYGDDIIHDEEIRLEWMRIPHFYNSFYVYQYATGISAAVSIATSILNKEKGALERYLKFLASGSSNYPIDLLKEAGVDMTSTKPIEDAIKMFDSIMNEYMEID